MTQQQYLSIVAYTAFAAFLAGLVVIGWLWAEGKEIRNVSNVLSATGFLAMGSILVGFAWFIVAFILVASPLLLIVFLSKWAFELRFRRLARCRADLLERAKWWDEAALLEDNLVETRDAAKAKALSLRAEAEKLDVPAKFLK